ncbi:hypothetical protein JCM21900_005380 [Sporobolomyces salmonicolor]
MRAAVVALSALSATALASHSPSSSHRRSLPKRSSSYSLTTHAAGQDFFDLFDFATGSDNGGIAECEFATGGGSSGAAQYHELTWRCCTTTTDVDSSTAWSNDLVQVKDGRAHIRVSSEGSGSTRQAVKLTSKNQYSEGLYIWDVERMPREIDIVEYVSHQSMNSFSVHTGPGCWAGSSGYTGTEMLATSFALDCDADATASQGCGFRTTRNNTAGIGANFGEGGVYAMEWSSDGIKAWFFARDSIPSDITEKNPDPSSWATPDMYVAASSCDPSTYFGPQTFAVNTNLCGTWPNGVWSTDNSYAGQSEGSCAATTGFATCEEYVQSRGEDFKHAYWRIASFSIYN